MAEGGSSREWYLSEELTQEILDAAAARYKCAQRRFPEDRILRVGYGRLPPESRREVEGDTRSQTGTEAVETMMVDVARDRSGPKIPVSTLGHISREQEEHEAGEALMPVSGTDSSMSMVEVKNIPEVVAEKKGSHWAEYADKRVESPLPPQSGNRSIRREPSTLDTDLPLGLLEAYEKPSSFSHSLAGQPGHRWNRRYTPGTSVHERRQIGSAVNLKRRVMACNSRLFPTIFRER
ncbi:hypothetical protein FOZ61_005120 [Perkinsus olseni]|uniref:Uncharacterized protein n=1 Tax=Perkinsus olseni TaxID=32597 RepID=A0A7J6LI58_PEROL|nr:hypothetical protein FOZ61_005120 [Perkinsus olseni]